MSNRPMQPPAVCWTRKLSSLIGLGVIGASVTVNVAQAQCSVPAVLGPTGVNANGAFSIADETQPRLEDSGDSVFDGSSFACNNSWLDDAESHFDVDVGQWQSGKGWDDPCNVSLMYGRFLTGLYVLNWSAPDPASSWGDMSGLPLRRAGNYAADWLVDIAGRCNYSTNWALTQYDTLVDVVDEWSRYYKGFAYQQTPVGRAATIYHESRHIADLDHDGNDGGNRCVERGTGCDERYDDYPNSARANSYEIHFLLDYTFRGVTRNFATGAVTSAPASQRRSAQRWGNYTLANRIDDRNTTGWRISGSSASPGYCTFPPQAPFFNPCPVVVL